MAGAKRIEFNSDFQHALKRIEIGASVFITGKAGTGKTTLLNHFLNTTTKNVLVVAPTGVAALNIGGSTIHRLFGFPPTVSVEFVKSDDYFPRNSYKTLRQLEVLVIDEISMVRADLLDAVDAALRRFGPNKELPFGGVQMVFVGDPYQLPPVVVGSEEEFFRSRYATPFFFSADCFRELQYEIVELEKVYRQSDSDFINILNSLRTGQASTADFEALNQRFQPDFEPPDDEFWVTLTTTNAMADSVNRKRLESIDSEVFSNKAEFRGEISSADYPTLEYLEFKLGAQVMLLTNDPKDEWVNGSMGVVVGFGAENGTPTARVRIVDSNSIVEVTPYRWEVRRPSIENGRVQYEVIGSFEQLPMKLAWAVTIHKSQGKTLSRVVVSLGRGTFADGQLYVALSRCTSLEGLVLKSLVKPHHVKVEREVTRFLNRRKAQSENLGSLGLAVLGIVATGVSRFDKVLEIAAVISWPDRSLERFSSLINPMRDIGDSDSHGLTATALSSAPTLPEAWPFFSRQLEGCCVVAHGLPLIQTMIERECAVAGFSVDLGLGIDTQSFTGKSLEKSIIDLNVVPPLEETALGNALLTKMLFDDVAPKLDSVVAYRPSAEIREFGRIQSRDDLDSSATSRTTSDPETTYLDRATLLVGMGANEDESRRALEDFAASLGLSGRVVQHLNMSLLEDLLKAAKRDLCVSEDELIEMERVSSILGVDAPVIESDSSSPLRLNEILAPGMEICFTGSATDSDGNALERSHLEDLARMRMLKPVKSVTKKCSILFAADPSSMSGKAKKARDQGVPVGSVSAFLNWIDSS
jgi:ATP-dependent DNA helicase PIF1